MLQEPVARAGTRRHRIDDGVAGPTLAGGIGHSA
jgi:hypothetical protein